MTVFFIVLLCVLLLLFVLYAIYRIAFGESRGKEGRLRYPGKEQLALFKEQHDEWMRMLSNIPHESVYIKNGEEMSLHGYLFAAEDKTAPIVMFFHGYRSSALSDGIGMLMMCRKMGYSFLAVDMRAHGLSEGASITFGVEERYDVVAWAQAVPFLLGGNVPVFLAGISMGGATVLMAQDLSLPATVCGIMADCPYSSPRAILHRALYQRGLLAFVVYPFLRLAALLFGHFNLEQTDAVRSVACTALPVLLFHGKEDRFVPHKMSEAIVKNAKNGRLVLVDGAGHGLSYYLARERYEQEVMDFCQAAVAEHAEAAGR